MKADLNEVKLTSKERLRKKLGSFSKKARSNVSEIDSSLLGWVLEVGSAIAAKGKPVAMVTKIKMPVRLLNTPIPIT